MPVRATGVPRMTCTSLDPSPSNDFGHARLVGIFRGEGGEQLRQVGWVGRFEPILLLVLGLLVARPWTPLRRARHPGTHGIPSTTETPIVGR